MSVPNVYHLLTGGGLERRVEDLSEVTFEGHFRVVDCDHDTNVRLRENQFDEKRTVYSYKLSDLEIGPLSFLAFFFLSFWPAYFKHFHWS